MSLISEALKRAEEQSGPPGTTPPGQNPQGPPPPPPNRRFSWRTILFGFLLISLGGTTASLFFAARIADESPSQPTTRPSPTPPAPESGPPDPPATAANGTASPTKPASPTQPDKTASAPPQQNRPESPPPPETKLPPEEPPEPPQPPQPDPALDARVKGFQVRAVVSGGNRILLHDPPSGKTQALRIGERLQMVQGLTLTRISEQSLTFTDHDGFQYKLFF